MWSWIKLPNWLDNIIVMIFTSVVAYGAFYMGHQSGLRACVETNKATMAEIIPMIEKAIAKETTAINNDIKLNFDKIKNSEGMIIQVDQKPTSTQNVVNQEIKTDSTKVKLGFFKKVGRFFGSKKNK